MPRRCAVQLNPHGPSQRKAALSRWAARSLGAPFAFALLLRLGLALAIPVRPVWDGAIYAESAAAIARGLGYTRAGIDAAHGADPSAFYPVGFPATLALLRLLGAGDAVELIVQSLAGALVRSRPASDLGRATMLALSGMRRRIDLVFAR